MKATGLQIKKLQTLFGQIARRDIGLENTREARLVWASEICAHPVKSFSELSIEDANHLIDQASLSLGQAPQRKRPDAAAARRAGLDGRHDGEEFAASPQLVSADDMATICAFYHRLGWDKARFEGFLASPRSPFCKRADKRIRTAADANQVRWALKRMLVRAGLWEERRSA